jgi:tRNA-dihydrouridine synthase A
MLGLRNGLPGARRWRQVWSDHRHAGLPAREVWAIADRVAREGQMAALA